MTLSVSLPVVFEYIYNLSVFIINPSTDQDKMLFFFFFSPPISISATGLVTKS